MRYDENIKDSFLSIVIILGLFIIFSFFDGQRCYGSNLCVGKKATLNCLRNNFDSLYSTNYSLFWSILRVAERKATSCKSVADTSDFLKLASIKSSNAEFNGYLSETIENLTIKKSNCFLDSLSTLDRDAMVSIISLLKNPMFVEGQSIMKVFSKQRNEKKYKQIMNIYFQTNQRIPRSGTAQEE